MSYDPYFHHKIKLIEQWEEGYLEGARQGSRGEPYPIYTMNGDKKAFWEGYRTARRHAMKVRLEFLKKI